MRKLAKLILLALCFATGSAAAQQTTLAPGATEEIFRHDVCRVVTNTNPDPVMIPTKSAAEWAAGQSSFLAESRKGMQVKTCGRITPTVSYVTSFSCPNPYNDMFCGGVYATNTVTQDGRYIFAFENADSGQKTPKLHIFRNESGVVSLVSTVTGLSAYPVPTAGLDITPSGSHFLLWERRFQNNPGYNPKIRVYSFDGSNVSEIASIATGAYTKFDAYTAPAMTEDARFILADTWLFERVGSSLVPLTVNGPALTMSNTTSSWDQMAKWSQALGGFVEAEIETGLYLTTPDPLSSGSWVRRLIYSPGTAVNHLFFDISDDGKKIALLRRNTFSASSQIIDILEKRGDIFVRAVSLTLPNQTTYYNHSTVAFTAVTGKILMVRYGRTIRQFDTANLESGAAPELPPLTLTNLMANDDTPYMSNMMETESGYILFSNALANSYKGAFELWYAQN